MSFLGLAFLFALPLAAAPILLHFFDRQRQVVIEWGAMQFLVEAARRRNSASQLQQWLLLLMRTLAILCLVMALARPLINSNWLRGSDRRETILVIDNSLSTMRSDRGTSYFQSEIQTAIERLDNLPAGESVRVLLTAPYPIWMNQASVSLNSDSRATIREQIMNLKPTFGHSDLLAAMFTAAQAETVPGTKHRSIAVLTDGQAADWSTGDIQGWQQLREIIRTPRVPTDFNMIIVGPPKPGTSNLAVNVIHCNRTQVAPRQSVTLMAQIQNHGNAPSDPCSLDWTVSKDEEHHSEVPALSPGEIHEVVWKHSFSKVGVYAVSAQLSANDLLIPDNQETVIVEVVDRIPVLVVESAPDADEMLQDAFVVQAALGWVNGQPLATQGVYEPTVVTPDRLNESELQRYQAVLIPSLSEIGESVIRKLHNFASDGGGVWIALGPRTDVERFNQHFFADADGLAPLSIDRLVDEPASADQKSTVDPFVGTHPATMSLLDSARLDVDKIVVSRRFQFTPARPGETVSVLLGLNNGAPLAVEKLVGRGRVIVQAVPLKLQWSELARSQAFVVIVQDWLNYLTQPRATRHNLSPGDPISLHLTGSDIHQATLRTPDGVDVELSADSTEDGIVFRTSRTLQPGDYSLETGLSGDKIPFHVHRDARESNLAPLSPAERQLLAETWGIHTGQSHSLHSSTPSDPIWPLLLIVLLCLMVAELLLSGSISRQRFGNDPIVESTEALAEEPSSLAGDLKTMNQSKTNKPTVVTGPRT